MIENEWLITTNCHCLHKKRKIYFYNSYGPLKILQKIDYF